MKVIKGRYLVESVIAKQRIGLVPLAFAQSGFALIVLASG
jgi:hypothetical protein